MLGEKILPTGIGHTTNCFLQVEGQENTYDPCIYIPGSDSPHDIKVLITCFYFKLFLIRFNMNRVLALLEVHCLIID
jgi:hypothetical protein